MGEARVVVWGMHLYMYLHVRVCVCVCVCVHVCVAKERGVWFRVGYTRV